MTYVHLCVIALEQQGENVKKNERGKENDTHFLVAFFFFFAFFELFNHEGGHFFRQCK